MAKLKTIVVEAFKKLADGCKTAKGEVETDLDKKLKGSGACKSKAKFGGGGCLTEQEDSE